MDLELKNGKKIKLEMSPLFLEYLEDYDGGTKKIFSDWEKQENVMYIINFFIYAIIASNLNEPISYRNSLKLVKMNDIEKIADFISTNIDLAFSASNKINNIKHF